VDLGNDGGTLADRRRDAFGRAGADVADREHPGEGGLERQGGTAGARAVRAGEAGDDEPLGIHRHAVLEPPGVGIGADEQEEMGTGQVEVAPLPR
jgi:hypothetical protein